MLHVQYNQRDTVPEISLGQTMFCGKKGESEHAKLESFVQMLESGLKHICCEVIPICDWTDMYFVLHGGK